VIVLLLPLVFAVDCLAQAFQPRITACKIAKVYFGLLTCLCCAMISASCLYKLTETCHVVVTGAAKVAKVAFLLFPLVSLFYPGNRDCSTVEVPNNNFYFIGLSGCNPEPLDTIAGSLNVLAVDASASIIYNYLSQTKLDKRSRFAAGYSVSDKSNPGKSTLHYLDNRAGRLSFARISGGGFSRFCGK
jgi:hypothetical protein